MLLLGLPTQLHSDMPTFVSQNVPAMCGLLSAFPVQSRQNAEQGMHGEMQLKMTLLIITNAPFL